MFYLIKKGDKIGKSLAKKLSEGDSCVELTDKEMDLLNSNDFQMVNPELPISLLKIDKDQNYIALVNHQISIGDLTRSLSNIGMTDSKFGIVRYTS